jgi:hypothetical protein
MVATRVILSVSFTTSLATLWRWVAQASSRVSSPSWRVFVSFSAFCCFRSRHGNSALRRGCAACGRRNHRKSVMPLALIFSSEVPCATVRPLRCANHFHFYRLSFRKGFAIDEMGVRGQFAWQQS